MSHPGRHLGGGTVVVAAGELLYSLVGGSRTLVAAGGGVLHEAGGANVLLARVMAGRNAERWRLHGNVVFQKPLTAGRDAVDLITSVGWAHDGTRALSLGVEAIGEDLEGFWEAEEADGGARLLMGPSVRISPAGRRWQLIATGGPLFHPSDTRRSSSAFRDLPPETRHVSYALKGRCQSHFRPATERGTMVKHPPHRVCRGVTAPFCARHIAAVTSRVASR